MSSDDIISEFDKLRQERWGIQSYSNVDEMLADIANLATALWILRQLPKKNQGFQPFGEMDD